MKKFIIIAIIISFSAANVAAKDFVGTTLEMASKVSDWLFEADSLYVGSQRYRCEVQAREGMGQQMLAIDAKDGSSVGLRSHLANRIGPYAYFAPIGFYYGWDTNVPHYHDTDAGIQRKTMNLEVSTCTQRFNARAYYQRAGGDYTITSFALPGFTKEENKFLSGEMKGTDNMGGAQMETFGAEVSYMTNFRKFSMPAAITGSKIQLRSAGSPVLGFSYQHSRLTNDWSDEISLIGLGFLEKEYETQEFQSLAAGQNKSADENQKDLTDEELFFKEFGMSLIANRMPTRMVMNDYGLQLGYSYNWVFAKNWLINVFLSFTPSIKHIHASNTCEFRKKIIEALQENPDYFLCDQSDIEELKERAFYDTRNTNIGFDALGSSSIVWNKGNMFASFNGSFRYKRWTSPMVNVHDRSWSVRFTFGYKFWKI